jgi:hypothetical protein
VTSSGEPDVPSGSATWAIAGDPPDNESATKIKIDTDFFT